MGGGDIMVVMSVVGFLCVEFTVDADYMVAGDLLDGFVFRDEFVGSDVGGVEFVLVDVLKFRKVYVVDRGDGFGFKGLFVLDDADSGRLHSWWVWSLLLRYGVMLKGLIVVSGGMVVWFDSVLQGSDVGDSLKLWNAVDDSVGFGVFVDGVSVEDRVLLGLLGLRV